MRVARQPVQARYLPPQAGRLAEQIEGGGRAPVAEGDVIAPARLLVLRVAHEGLVLGVLEPQQKIPVVVAPRALQVGSRQALRFFGGESEPRLVVPDIARERLAYLLQPLQDRLHARALLRGQGHSRVLDRLPPAVLPLAVDAVGGRGPPEPRGNRFVREKLGAELLAL